MPTLASIHSSQATIGIEVQPSQPGFHSGKGVSTDSMLGLVLDHSRVHLLMSPESVPLDQALKALGGSRKRPHEWGMSLNLNSHEAGDILVFMRQLSSISRNVVGLTLREGPAWYSMCADCAVCHFSLPA